MNILNILIFIFGSVVGSFLNVCIYRLPRNRSIILPNSFCPSCEKPIKL
ncbi:MAG: prepilin peptidase, partial [Proteobacteria bacterium]|nr:prepilin peptidase [Pseudomonadota bacterium]